MLFCGVVKRGDEGKQDVDTLRRLRVLNKALGYMKVKKQRLSMGRGDRRGQYHKDIVIHAGGHISRQISC